MAQICPWQIVAKHLAKKRKVISMKTQEQMLFSRKALSKIIIPLVLQGLLSVAIGMVDSMMVSNKGEDAFAGVSLIGSLDILLITLFSSIAAGGSVVLAQAMGRGEQKECCHGAKQLLYITTLIAASISTTVILLRVPLLRLLFGQVTAAVMQNALEYFFFIALSFPFLAIYDCIAAVFRAQGESMISLKISIFMNLLNVAGNALLIYGIDLGAAGAAIATLVSRIIGSIIMIVLCHSKKRYIYLEKLFRYRPDFKTIRSILRIGVPNGVENSMFQLGRLMTASLISSLGTTAISANAAALSLANLQYTAGGAIQSTQIAVVGRCVGAEKRDQAKHYAKRLLGVSYLLVFGVDLLVCLLSTPLLRLFSLSAEAFSLGRDLLFFHSAVSVILWPTAFCLPPAFRAANDIRFSLVVSTFSMWAFRVALAFLLAPASTSFFGLFTIPGLGMGIFGVWIAMFIDWAFRAIFFGGRLLGTKWLTKYKSESASDS